MGSFYDDATCGAFLSHCPNLTYLDLTNCAKSFKVGRGQTSATVQALVNLKALQTINLKEVPIEIGDFERLVGSATHLKFLYVTRMNTNLTNSAKKFIDFQPSVQFLSQRPIEQLILQNFAALPDSFGTALRANSPTLQELDISGASHLTDATAEAIACCSSLISLSIDGCPFSEKAIDLILRSCINLIMVNLGGTMITDANIKTLLVDVPSVHPVKKSLHTLQISGCTRLTRDCLSYIQTQKNLRVLKLSRSSFVNQDNIINLVLAIPSLNYLDVSSCQNMPKQEEAIKQLLHDLVAILPTANIRIQLYK